MRKRGFTLIELSVVIVILAMMAALVVPNIATAITGGRSRLYVQSVSDIVRQAREEAVFRKATVSLNRTDDGAFQLSTNQDGQTTQIKQTQTSADVTASAFESGGQSMSEGDWTVKFYADGTCDGGAFQLDANGASAAYRIRRSDGHLSITQGALDTTDDPDTRWDVTNG